MIVLGKLLVDSTTPFRYIPRSGPPVVSLEYWSIVLLLGPFSAMDYHLSIVSCFIELHDLGGHHLLT